MKSIKKSWGGHATYRKDEKFRKNVIGNAEKKRNLGRDRRR
jgi:hypothetical protein